MALYRLLLYLCPQSFRAEYGAEMAAMHTHRLSQAGAAGKLWLWLEAIADILTTAIAAHADLLRQDLHYSVRAAAKSPGFTVTAILVAALGVAAPTAIFSLANHVFLKPLPFRDAERLVDLWEDKTAKGFGRYEASPANYRDWRRLSKSFESMAAYAGSWVNISGAGEPMRVTGLATDPVLFRILGATPLFGRTQTDEDAKPNAPGTVVLSHALWRKLFGDDRNVLGKRLLFDGKPHTIIGVMPPGFIFPSPEEQMWTVHRPGEMDDPDRRNNYLRVIAKLAPGVTFDQAVAEMRVIGNTVAQQYPAELNGTSATAVRMRDEVGTRGRNLIVALIAASLCILLIAVGNLANLFLVRASARRTEITVRTALGAGRHRLIRQLLTESLLLATVGGALGVAVAAAAMPLFVDNVPSYLPLAPQPELDGRVLCFALLTTFVTGIAFGVVPALRSTSGQNLALRSRTGAHRDFARRTLVAAQVAASVALLASTGLLIRALERIQHTQPGFDPVGRFAFRTSLPMPKYENTAVRERFYREVLEQLRALPQVRSVAVISFRPMGDFRGGIWPLAVPGKEKGEIHFSSRFVTPGYFDAMHISLLRGRDFADSDNQKSMPVAIVSQSLLEALWPPGEEGVGRVFEMPFTKQSVQIIGVAANVLFRGLDRRSEPQIYFASAQMLDGAFTFFAPKDFIVSASTGLADLMPAIQRIVARADPIQPISDVRTMEGVLEDDTSSRRSTLRVLGGFALAAFLLAGIGIHGLLAFAVAQRTSEIGLRRALGASNSSVVSLILGEGMLLAAAGSLLGVLAAYAVGRGIEAILAGVPPSDPVTLAASLALAFVMTIAGTLLPAARALLIDPAVALRAET